MYVCIGWMLVAFCFTFEIWCTDTLKSWIHSHPQTGFSTGQTAKTWYCTCLNIHACISDAHCSRISSWCGACASPLQLTSQPAWRSRWLRQYFLLHVNFKGRKAGLSDAGDSMPLRMRVCDNAAELHPVAFISASPQKLICAGLAETAVISLLCCMCVSHSGVSVCLVAVFVHAAMCDRACCAHKPKLKGDFTFVFWGGYLLLFIVAPCQQQHVIIGVTCATCAVGASHKKGWPPPTEGYFP